MSLSPEQLAAWDSFFSGHFDKIGHEGSYDPPPSDISSDANDIPTGLLTPSREDHGAAIPTRIGPQLQQRHRRRRRRDRQIRGKPQPDQSVDQFRQWMRGQPGSSPDYFSRLGMQNSYIWSTPRIEHDWEDRSLRSKRWKPHLFALDYTTRRAGEVAIAVLGDDGGGVKVYTSQEEQVPDTPSDVDNSPCPCGRLRSSHFDAGGVCRILKAVPAGIRKRKGKPRRTRRFKS